MTRRRTFWEQRIDDNPGHSAWYIQRWRTMLDAGDDIVGEGRFVDAMVPRGARILDAGCGQGRVGGYLAGQGHSVPVPVHAGLTQPAPPEVLRARPAADGG